MIVVFRSLQAVCEQGMPYAGPAMQAASSCTLFSCVAIESDMLENFPPVDVELNCCLFGTKVMATSSSD